MALADMTFLYDPPAIQLVCTRMLNHKWICFA